MAGLGVGSDSDSGSDSDEKDFGDASDSDSDSGSDINAKGLLSLLLPQSEPPMEGSDSDVGSGKPSGWRDALTPQAVSAVVSIEPSSSSSSNKVSTALVIAGMTLLTLVALTAYKYSRRRNHQVSEETSSLIKTQSTLKKSSRAPSNVKTATLNQHYGTTDFSNVSNDDDISAL